MKMINMNGVWYDAQSPSLYQCRDVPGVSICFKERKSRKFKKRARRVGQKKITVIRTYETTIVREWLVLNTDNKTQLRFASLSEASLTIAVAYSDLNRNIEEDHN